MTPPLTLRPVAGAEITEAYEWYEERRQGLVEGVPVAFRDALATVEQAPQRYPVIRNDVRRVFYSVLYLADADATVLPACLHGRRDPRRWHDRR